MNVSKLPVDPGPAGWNELLPPPPPARVLEDGITADWLIIGGGFAGLAAARRLSQLDPTGRIVILEARRIAEGPAGRNSGVMVDLPHNLASDDYGGALEADLAQTRANRHAMAFAADMARAFGLPDEAHRAIGKINAAASPRGHQHNLDFAEHLTRMGEPHELYDAQTMAAITGTDYYQSGLHTPGAVILQPAMFVRGVASGLASNRVQIFENSPVTALDKGWTATTPKGTVTAPQVILAVNGHMQSFGFAPRRLMHVFTYASMTRELSADEVARLGGHPFWAATPADPMGTTVRRIDGTGGHRIVVRNRFTFDPTMEVDQRRIATVARDHDRAFAARFPMLRGVTMQFRWGGRLCLSRNNVQMIRHLDDGLTSACCQNGLGTAKGTFAGMMAAEIAAGHPSDFATTALAEPEPTRLPPEPVASLGANAYLRWKEWRAGADF